MKILYHHRTQGVRVEGVHIREIVKALKSLGHSVTLVSPPGVDPFRDYQQSIQKKSAVSKVLSFLSRHAPDICFEVMELCYNMAAYRNITAVIKEEKPDLIYERYAFFSFAGVLVSKKNKIPLILEVNEVSGIERQRGQVLKWLANKIEKYIFNEAYGIVTVSSYLKNHIVGIGVEKSKIKVVPNAVDIKDFDLSVSGSLVRQKYNFEGKTVLGFVGAFSVWDKLEFLIDTFEKMTALNKDLRLILIGDGFNKQILERYVSGKGLNNYIIFTGRVGRQEIASHIAAIDICVIPHSNPFGSPVVMFEYMSLEKAVVAPALLPVLDVITDGINGLVFPLNNRQELINCLDKLIKTPQLRKQLGQNARKSVLEKHTWPKNAQAIIDLKEALR
jgi:glycosyltransferase involved in cell wall biosynthesis